MPRVETSRDKQKMVNSTIDYPILDEIERSESYLVCCMFEEAVSLASSVIRRVHTEAVELEDIQLNDVLESAGMVLVQSWKELGRTHEMLKELILLFGSPTSIPFQVLLTGVCCQIRECVPGVREFLEEFFSHWKFVDERYYIAANVEANVACAEGCAVLGVDEYLEVVEVYVATLTATISNKSDLAISWVEKAEIPEEKRQELLRRLHSIHSSKVSSSLQASASPLLVNESRSHSASLRERTKCKELSDALKIQDSSNGENAAKLTAQRFSLQKVPYFWLLHSILLKFKNKQLVILKGSFLLGLLLFSVCYLMRKKQTSLMRSLKGNALSMKKVLVDLWQLAFSYQVNPLAAIQPLPVASRGSQ